MVACVIQKTQSRSLRPIAMKSFFFVSNDPPFVAPANDCCHTGDMRCNFLSRFNFFKISLLSAILSCCLLIAKKIGCEYHLKKCKLHQTKFLTKRILRLNPLTRFRQGRVAAKYKAQARERPGSIVAKDICSIASILLMTA